VVRRSEKGKEVRSRKSESDIGEGGGQEDMMKSFFAGK